jgi:pantoate--beta-alanine ligase
LEIVHTVEWMKQVARQARAAGRMAGLVPTMGALHAGHLSLVERARRETSPVIVSVFVNPAQFAPGEDYARYPRTLEADCEALAGMGVDFLFAPSAEEMYPPGFRTAVTVEGLGDRLEGRVRPGHFRGVATVVLKLLEIAVPRFSYFGRKDAQQARVIRQMARDLALDPEIVVCPIVREPDGLARSSRNAYLSARERQAATVLYRALDAVQKQIAAGERQSSRLMAAAREVLASEPLAKTDYVEVVEEDSFESVHFLRGKCLMLLAVRIGATRLIDNLYVEAQPPAETQPLDMPPTKAQPGAAALPVTEMESRAAAAVRCEL